MTSRRDFVRRGLLWSLSASAVDPLEAIDRLTWRRKSFALGGLTPTVRVALFGLVDGEMRAVTPWRDVANVPGGEFMFDTVSMKHGTVVELRAMLPEELQPRLPMRLPDDGIHVMSIRAPEGRPLITNGGTITFRGQPLQLYDA